MKKGLTMIEVIVCTCILAILCTVLLLITDSSSRQYKRGITSLDASSTAKAVMLDIEASIRKAEYAFCSCDSLKIIGLLDQYKVLMYIQPFEKDRSPYLLVLKKNGEEEYDLRKLYLNYNHSYTTSADVWMQQGSTITPNADFSFSELTEQENASLNSQLEDYICTWQSEGLTRLAVAPLWKDVIKEADCYYTCGCEDECAVHANIQGVNSLVYLEHIKYKKYTRMNIVSNNIVMDGIEDVKIIQNEKGSFHITVLCSGVSYSTTAVMRSYERGKELEKK